MIHLSLLCATCDHIFHFYQFYLLLLRKYIRTVFAVLVGIYFVYLSSNFNCPPAANAVRRSIRVRVGVRVRVRVQQVSGIEEARSRRSIDRLVGVVACTNFISSLIVFIGLRK